MPYSGRPCSLHHSTATSTSRSAISELGMAALTHQQPPRDRQQSLTLGQTPLLAEFFRWRQQPLCAAAAPLEAAHPHSLIQAGTMAATASLSSFQDQQPMSRSAEEMAMTAGQQPDRTTDVKQIRRRRTEKNGPTGLREVMDCSFLAAAGDRQQQQQG